MLSQPLDLNANEPAEARTTTIPGMASSVPQHRDLAPTIIETIRLQEVLSPNGSGSVTTAANYTRAKTFVAMSQHWIACPHGPASQGRQPHRIPSWQGRGTAQRRSMSLDKPRREAVDYVTRLAEPRIRHAMAESRERILLTGAAGFIGSHVAERLLARGDWVVGVDNFDPFYSPDEDRKSVV